jgi:hypothetical protein
MKRTCSLLAALLLAASGCHMCSDCCDYSSCVANGPYAGIAGRAGSNSSGQLNTAQQPDPLAGYPAPAPPAEQPIN